jgi:hypothetical protein
VPVAVTPEVVARCRQYIAHCRSTRPSGAEEGTGAGDGNAAMGHEAMAEDMLAEKAVAPEGLFNDTPSVRHNTFNVWATLGRCLAASYGEHAVTEARWGEMKALEKARFEAARGI